MRWLALSLIILLGLAHGYPLHGSNGMVNSTIYGAFKEHFVPGNVDAGKNVKLYVDLSLESEDSNDEKSIGADYTLMDMNDKAYKMRPDYSRDLQPGRWLIGFVVPEEAIAKSLIVKPSDMLGERFVIDFDEVTNASNDNATFVYYGVVGSKIDSNRKSIKFDVALTNNASDNLPASASNFSLIDQWGWRYASQEYDKYTNSGFPSVELKPNQTIRANLMFDGLSPLARPVNLVYEYTKNSSISLDIDTESGLRSLSEKHNICGGQGLPADTTLAGSIKATKARLARVRASLNSSN